MKIFIFYLSMKKKKIFEFFKLNLDTGQRNLIGTLNFKIFQFSIIPCDEKAKFKKERTKISNLDCSNKIYKDSYLMQINIKSNVFGWGANFLGKLGDGTNNSSNLPQQVEINDLLNISGGGFHSLALKNNKTALAWGSNGYGQLGDGSNQTSYLPVSVLNLSNLISISSGSWHSLAIREPFLPPPPVNNSGIGAARFTKGEGGLINVQYDNSTCIAEHISILYGNLGYWDGYSDCALSKGGNNGFASFDSSSQNNVWYKIIWVNGEVGGHPGLSSSGERNFSSVGFCGITSEDFSDNSCD